MRSSVSASVVFPEFHAAAVFPGKNNPFGVDDLQLARHEAGVAKFLLGHLAFTHAGLDVRAKGDGAAGHVLVARDFHGHYFLAGLADLDDLVKVTAVMADPLSGKIDS